MKVKNLCRFSPLFVIEAEKVKTIFVELPAYTISISMTIEIHKNNLAPPELLTNSTVK